MSCLEVSVNLPKCIEISAIVPRSCIEISVNSVIEPIDCSPLGDTSIEYNGNTILCPINSYIEDGKLFMCDNGGFFGVLDGNTLYFWNGYYSDTGTSNERCWESGEQIPCCKVNLAGNFSLHSDDGWRSGDTTITLICNDVISMCSNVNGFIYNYKRCIVT